MRLGYKICIGSIICLLITLFSIDEFTSLNLTICYVFGAIAFVMAFLTYLDPED